MKIWHSNKQKPIPYKLVVMEFDKPFGDQLPPDEQESVYECYEMRYYGDGNGREWQAFKQCNRWAYLEDIIATENHVNEVVQLNESIMYDLGVADTKLAKAHRLLKECKKFFEEEDPKDFTILSERMEELLTKITAFDKDMEK